MQEPKSIELLTLINQTNNRLIVFKKKSGLTVNALSILFILQKDKNMMQKDIAEYLRVSKATVGAELKILEQRGFICRLRGMEDAREIRVSITKAGLVQYSLVVRDLNNRLKDIVIDALLDDLERVFKIFN